MGSILKYLLCVDWQQRIDSSSGVVNDTKEDGSPLTPQQHPNSVPSTSGANIDNCLY